jgi:hypothetical protein
VDDWRCERPANAGTTGDIRSLGISAGSTVWACICVRSPSAGTSAVAAADSGNS